MEYKLKYSKWFFYCKFCNTALLFPGLCYPHHRRRPPSAAASASASTPAQWPIVVFSCTSSFLVVQPVVSAYLIYASIPCRENSNRMASAANSWYITCSARLRTSKPATKASGQDTFFGGETGAGYGHVVSFSPHILVHMPMIP